MTDILAVEVGDRQSKMERVSVAWNSMRGLRVKVGLCLSWKIGGGFEQASHYWTWKEQTQVERRQ